MKKNKSAVADSSSGAGEILKSMEDGSSVWTSASTSEYIYNPTTGTGAATIVSTPGIYPGTAPISGTIPLSAGYSYGVSTNIDEPKRDNYADGILDAIEKTKLSTLEDVLDDLESCKNTLDMVEVMAKVQKKIERLKEAEKEKQKQKK
jgi:hypothetical protein